MSSLKVFCVNDARYIEVSGGDTLADILASVRQSLDFNPICAKVNNKTEPLSFSVYSPKMVEFISPDSADGQRIYVRTLCMMLYKGVEECLPKSRLRIEHSVAGGHYCRLARPDGSFFVPTPQEVADILAAMRRLASRDLTIVAKERLTKDALELFRRQGLDAKVMLLEELHNLYTTFNELDGLADSFYGPLAPSTGHIPVFDLLPYKEGMLLLGPSADDSTRPAEPKVQDKLYAAFTDYLRFNRVIKVSNAGELNRAVRAKETAQLINVAEAMHDKLLGRISDEIMRRRAEGGARVVLIAGPSSSGKTTSTKRLAIQLMTNMMTPKMISLDDYFLDRTQTPRDEDGELDYESLYALDLERLNSDLKRLIAGEEINLPTYSFEFGRRIEKPRPLRLDKDDILLIEGIHGLNPDLLPDLDSKDVFKVYVSALTTLGIDDHNWLSTTDTRLLRRIVRDYKYRHTSALETIRRWPSVRRGEQRWIFPFQENADAMFNSSLIFEIAVMREYAEPLLHEVPHDAPEYSEAYRLLRLLSYFLPVRADQVPTTSLLREFLGGSSFKY